MHPSVSGWCMVDQVNNSWNRIVEMLEDWAELLNDDQPYLIDAPLEAVLTVQ